MSGSTPPGPLSLHDLSFDQLESRLAADGVRPVHASALWRALHRDLDCDVSQRLDFVPPLRRWVARGLEGAFTLDRPIVADTITSRDGSTRKLLLRLRDGQQIETVIMGYPGRFTVCLSTQAGCAMGCVFCATGHMGFARQLRPGEMVAQVLQAQRLLRSLGQSGPRNIVLMGMGEPLHNYDAVIQALRILSDARGANIGPGRITVSTVGIVPAMMRFAEEQQPYHLAVSLHAAQDTQRSALVPVNRRWPLSELLHACRFYNTLTGRRVFFSWTLIAGQNDSPQHATELVELLRGLDAHLNLIQLNPTDGYAGCESPTLAAEKFRRIVRAAGFPCTMRQRRGIDVGAGCGQLRAEVAGVSSLNFSQES